MTDYLARMTNKRLADAWRAYYQDLPNPMSSYSECQHAFHAGWEAASRLRAPAPTQDEEAEARRTMQDVCLGFNTSQQPQITNHDAVKTAIAAALSRAKRLGFEEGRVSVRKEAGP